MISRARFDQLVARYASLRIAVVGDFCLDRYLEIDPTKEEISIETNLPVHNVTRLRSQAGGAGTILNNLVALGVSDIYPIGFCGEDGEGYELRRALEQLAPAAKETFLTTPLRRTFTYCKPLVIEGGQPPRELNRLDSKNWSPTPAEVSAELADRLLSLAAGVDAIILLDQVDQPETGVVTGAMLSTVAQIARQREQLLIMADCRRGLMGYPPVALKMNRAELAAMNGGANGQSIDEVGRQAAELSANNGRPVFVSLADDGIIGAEPGGQWSHAPARPIHGAIDIVGAGDCVMANLVTALAARASMPESLEIAMAAASIVIHQLGTTGTASTSEIAEIVSS